MKRLLRSWVFWAFIAGPAVLLALTFTRRDYEMSLCPRCYSVSWSSLWRVGDHRAGYLTIWRGWTTRAESHLVSDGWVEAHEHERWLGARARSVLEPFGDSAELLGRYETNAAFRTFLIAKNRAGEAAREDFLVALEPPFGRVMVCGVPEDPVRAQARSRAQAWVLEFLRAPYSAMKRLRAERTPP